ncbi:hypothetical protein [Amphritea sp. HPY]|uniref:hypothetical protein n=1 Tax=Amphritea sp. HPY TaxID=3421652 RepID=UPI003D7D8058
MAMEHGYFGTMLFMADDGSGDEGSGDDGYWEAELSIAAAKEPLTILINAPGSGPDAAQVAFCQQVLADPDALFDKCWPIFEPDFEQWTGTVFSGNWQDDFELMSIEIPRHADTSEEWAVGYYVDAANHYFTARFIDGKPCYNEIDG